MNRFSGFDCLGDNNRISLAITSRLFEQDTGAEKVHFTLGQAYYFNERRVCLTPTCAQDTLITESISPIISELKYYLTPNLTVKGDYSWDPNLSDTQSASASIRYQPGVNNLIFLGYTFERQGDVIDFANRNSSENNLSRAKIAVAKPLTENIHILGHFNYNVSHEYPQSYSVGLEYQGCCVAVRGIYSQILRNESLNGTTDYDTAFYLQFQLKGLGTAETNNPAKLLRSSIPGYTDKLRR